MQHSVPDTFDKKLNQPTRRLLVFYYYFAFSFSKSSLKITLYLHPKLGHTRPNVLIMLLTLLFGLLAGVKTLLFDLLAEAGILLFDLLSEARNLFVRFSPEVLPQLPAIKGFQFPRKPMSPRASSKNRPIAYPSERAPKANLNKPFTSF